MVETVNVRTLWAFLGAKSRFNDWIQRRIEEYEFQQGVDFTCAKNDAWKYQQLMRHDGTNEPVDYYVSIDMAKELCMVERTERGRQARQAQEEG